MLGLVQKLKSFLHGKPQTNGAEKTVGQGMTIMSAEKLSNDEYLFLKEDLPPGDPERHLNAGQSCYAEGLIDDFGLITPKGYKVIQEYEMRIWGL